MLEEKLENIEKHLETLEEKVQDVYDYQKDIDCIQDKLIALDDRFCRNNLRIDGVMEEKRETCGMCKDKVEKLFKEKLGSLPLIMNIGYMQNMVK